jgi:hypothetical protein
MRTGNEDAEQQKNASTQLPDIAEIPGRTEIERLNGKIRKSL